MYFLLLRLIRFCRKVYEKKRERRGDYKLQKQMMMSKLMLAKRGAAFNLFL